MSISNEYARIIVTFLEKYDEHFRELLTFLSDKLEKVTADDLVWLQDSLMEEERLVMRGNALEQRRLDLMAELDLADYTADMLYDDFPDEELRGLLRRAVDSISAAIYYIKETNGGILDLIEKKLEAQARIISKEDPTLAPTAVLGTETYNSKGSKRKINTGSEDIGSV